MLISYGYWVKSSRIKVNLLFYLLPTANCQLHTAIETHSFLIFKLIAGTKFSAPFFDLTVKSVHFPIPYTIAR